MSSPVTIPSQGPHGAYTGSTSRCNICHTPHDAAEGSAKLLPAATVEQKNWPVVRQNVGYARFDTPGELQVLKEIHSLVRLHTNFFMPSAKLISGRAYYYLVESARVDGKPRIVSQRYLGPADEVLARLCCVLALAVAHLMRREAARSGVSMSVRELVGALSGIEEKVLLYEGQRGRPKAR